MVKANAYGHGAVKVAQTVLKAGAGRLAVATLTEALELRNAAIDAPILVLGYTPTDLFALAVANNITLTIYDLESAQALDYQAAQQSKNAVVHVKVNTGMNRLGLRPEACLAYLTHLNTLENVQVEGIYTHFATADEADQSFAIEQFNRFQTMLATLKKADLRPLIAHAANSAATLTLPQTHLDMVRTGIAIYGLDPDPKSCRLSAEFRPALTWKAQVAHVNQLTPGESVSYGREFTSKQTTQIAVIPVGYADGFPRKPQHWNHVLIQGKPAPIVGRVCMDQTMVDISAMRPASDSTPSRQAKRFDKDTRGIKQGDEVVLIGCQNGTNLSAEEVAEQIGTNNYDVVSRILSRVPRIYV